MATKGTREAQRQTILVQELQKVSSLITGSFALPLNPAMLVSGLDIEVLWWTGEEGMDWGGGWDISAPYCLEVWCGICGLPTSISVTSTSQNCSFFNSKSVPLKLVFKNADPFGSNINVIYKVWSHDLVVAKVTSIVHRWGMTYVRIYWCFR